MALASEMPLDLAKSPDVSTSPVTSSPSFGKARAGTESALTTGPSACENLDLAAMEVPFPSSRVPDCSRHDPLSTGIDDVEGHLSTEDNVLCPCQTPNHPQSTSGTPEQPTATDILQSVLQKHLASRETVRAQFRFEHRSRGHPTSEHPAVVAEANRRASRYYFLKTKEDMTREYRRYRKDEASQRFLCVEENNVKHLLRDGLPGSHDNDKFDREDRHVDDFADSRFVMNLFRSLDEVLPGDKRVGFWSFTKDA